MGNLVTELIKQENNKNMNSFVTRLSTAETHMKALVTQAVLKQRPYWRTALELKFAGEDLLKDINENSGAFVKGETATRLARAITKFYFTTNWMIQASREEQKLDWCWETILSSLGAFGTIREELVNERYKAILAGEGIGVAVRPGEARRFA